jgi:DNA-binding NarL/FixJ family response regulator
MVEKIILIVENEVILNMGYGIIVKEMGYQVVRVAFAGHDAILLSDQFRPNLVLMDINLAGYLDGIDAAHKIQDRFNIPVVFITGHTDSDIQERAKRINPAGYIQKPLNENVLQATLEKYL